MDLKPKLKTLSSGLSFLKLPLESSQSVTAMLLVKVGSRYESKSISGLSHFLEHLVFKGTEKYNSPLKLASVVDSIGAEFNAFTSKEYTGFYVKSASAYLDLSLDVLSQLVFQPLLKASDIKREKGVILEEINMREDTPMYKVGEDLESLMYQDTSLGRRIIGFKETVLKMQIEDFLKYRQTWYQPSRMILGLVGGFEKADSLVNKYFSLNFKKEKNLFKDKKKKVKDLKTLSFSQIKPEVNLGFKKTEQAHLALGLRTFPRGHQDRYVLAVLSTILGGNMSSRLFTEVREKRGLGYYIKSAPESYFDNGYLMVQAGVDLKKVKETVKVILNELHKTRGGRGEIEDLELKKAKQYLEGKLALSLEDSKDIASFFTEDYLLEGRVRTIKEIIKGVKKVSLSDLKRVAKIIFTQKNLNLALIGPYRDEEQFENLLKL